jgi:hypothetical protein
MKALQAARATSLRAIAAAPTDHGIPTARGAGKWSAVQARERWRAWVRAGVSFVLLWSATRA